MAAMKPCSWCDSLTSHEITIERRHSAFNTNTPAGRTRVRADFKVPCCRKCKDSLLMAREAVKKQKEAGDRMATSYLQTTVQDQIAEIEKEKNECSDR